MSEDYREDINQNVVTQMDWTRWWSLKEWAKIVPGGRNMPQRIRVLLGSIGWWIGPVVQVLPGSDWLAYAVFVLLKAYILPLAVCVLLVFFGWLTRKFWRAWQQRF